MFIRVGNYLIESEDEDRRSGTVFNVLSNKFYNYDVSGYSGKIMSRYNLPKEVLQLIEKFVSFELDKKIK